MKRLKELTLLVSNETEAGRYGGCSALPEKAATSAMSAFLLIS